MSDEHNPYQSPQTEIDAIKPLIAQGTLTETMLRSLRGASPWLRFIGILGFISSGFFLLSGIAAILTGALVDESLYSSLPGNISVFMEAIGSLTGLLNIAAGVIYFFPARFTYAFGSRIRDYFRTNAEKDLEAAFKSNKSLWKFNGVMAIILLAFIPIMIILTVVVFVAAASGGSLRLF
ncbi:MAG: hypothetical protein LBD24_00620 [Spirochaetaceae bacterium]|jgi:hypothetical protein|nr:hypothetical protein [Spirochaetaceae bacterium]